MIGRFLSLVGVGIVSGAACKMGYMLADALFPNGLGKFVSRFKRPKTEN